MKDMEDAYVKGRHRKVSQVRNLHYYQVDLFYAVIDMEHQELSNSLNEVNTKLLICVACLSPKTSFSAFDKVKLLKMAGFYLYKFSIDELAALKNLGNFIGDVHGDKSLVKLIE